MLLGAAALSFSAQAQVLRSATDRAAQIYWYQQTLNERATREARELGRVLGLNESEMQLVRQFAAARLQAENEAQALIVNDPVGRREAQERASAQFQTRLVNTLNESQMQRYFQLLAETTTTAEKAAATTAAPASEAESAPAPAAPVVPAEIAPAIVPLTPAPAAVVEAAPAVPTPAPAVQKAKRRYVPIGTYHRRAVRRR